ncbi:hypothetical protein D3C81_1172150 [compost metagenome]
MRQEQVDMGVAEHGRKLFTLHLADLSAEQQTIRQLVPPQSHETALLFVAEYWGGQMSRVRLSHSVNGMNLLLCRCRACKQSSDARVIEQF